MTTRAPAGQPANVADLIRDAVRRDPAHPALIDGADGRTVSWAQLDRLVDLLAGRLDAAGLRAGDRVLIRLPTGIDFCVALFGTLRAGGVAVPAPVDAPSPAIEHLLTDSGARFAFSAEPPDAERPDNGFNVYPHEVEAVLGELDEVAEAAAVGLPHERTGEAVHAFVVLAAPDAEALRTHCAGRLARFKVPHRVEFVAALPHTVTGEIARRRLGQEAR